MYSIHQVILHALNTTPVEIKRFMGINYLMSVIKYPNVRMYWGIYASPRIIAAMTRNRHEKIRQFLHINNNNEMSRCRNT